MSKFEFTRRLDRMIDKECEITSLETKIAKRSAKHYEETNNLRNTLIKQLRELESYRREVGKMKRQNQCLEDFIRGEEMKLADTVKRTKDMNKEYEDIKQKVLEARKGMGIKIDLIRKIKLTTQTYFNMDALPQRFQGVKVYQKENGSEWKPFVNDVKQWIQFLEEQLQNSKQKESSSDDKSMTMDTEDN